MRGADALARGGRDRLAVHDLDLEAIGADHQSGVDIRLRGGQRAIGLGLGRERRRFVERLRPAPLSVGDAQVHHRALARQVRGDHMVGHGRYRLGRRRGRPGAARGAGRRARSAAAPAMVTSSPISAAGAEWVMRPTEM